MRNQPLGAVVYGIDLGKIRFDVVGCDAAGRPIQRVKFSRDTLFRFFAAAPKVLIGMEACPGAQWMARKLSELGHTVRIIPAQFVKPFVKSNKNDARDAEAIAEAVTRPTMRFVQIKSCEQIDLQALHRARDRIVGNRTQLICQMRAFCLEYGIAIRPGTGAFKLDCARIITYKTNDLTPAIRGLLKELGSSTKLHWRQDHLAWHQQARQSIYPPVTRSRRPLLHDPSGSIKRPDGHLDALDGRMHRNKAIVALANKIARIAWVLLRRPQTIYERIASAHALSVTFTNCEVQGLMSEQLSGAS